jgi:hypothetical protein
LNESIAKLKERLGQASPSIRRGGLLWRVLLVKTAVFYNRLGRTIKETIKMEEEL